MSGEEDAPGTPPSALVEWSQTVLGFVLKGFLLLTALLGFLGLKEGALDRILRNYAASSIAVGMLLAVGVVGGTIVMNSTRGRTRAIGTGIAAASVALALTAALVLGVASKDTTDRPIISTSVEEVNGQLTLKFAASASGLRHQEFLSVELEGLSSTVPVYHQVSGRFGSRDGHVESAPVKRDPLDPTEEFVTRLTYRFVGGDIDGKATTEGSYTLPWGIYERVRTTASVIASTEPEPKDVIRCDRRAEHRSCVAIALPPPPVKPSLVPTLAGDKVTAVTAVAKQLRSTQLLTVSITALNGAGPERLVTSAKTGPSADGNASISIPVPTPPANGAVCVVAGITENLLAQSAAVPPLPTGSPSTSGAPPATVPGDGGANGAPGAFCSAGETEVQLQVR